MIKVAPDVIRLRFRLCISNLHLVCIKDNFILTRRSDENLHSLTTWCLVFRIKSTIFKDAFFINV